MCRDSGGNAGTPGGVLWYILWYIAPRAAAVIGFVLEGSCQTTIRLGRGLNKHHLWDLIRMLIFFKRGRLREFASGRQTPGEQGRQPEERTAI